MKQEIRKRCRNWKPLRRLSVAAAFHDKAMMKCLLNLMQKLPKEAFVDDNVYTYKVTQSTLDLWEKIEQDVATWQRIRAKQPRSRQRIELICEWQHLELPAIAVEDSILVCTENLDANVVMMKSAQDRV